jgi:hypothetical protein
MAVLAHTEPVLRLPVGDRIMLTFRITAPGTGAADEWIKTGLSVIDAVVGCVVIGSATAAEAPAFVLNAQGTGETAGSSLGDLGFETTGATPNTFEITVIGTP